MTRDRRGFTFVEVLIVAVLIGILAGIALPYLAKAVDRASAAKVVSDARTLSLAARQHLEEGNDLPPTEDWGVFPTDLGRYVQANLPFTFRDAEYRFVSQPGLDDAQLWVRYPEESGIAQALKGHRGSTVTWTPTRTTFFLME